MTGDPLSARRVEPGRRPVVSNRPDPEDEGANFSTAGSLRCMGVLIGHPPGPETTRALLERIAGGEGARRLRAQVARWNADATPEQIEDAFQEACARAEHACAGQMEGEVYNWLRTTTHREIAHQRRRWERESVIDVPVEELELADHCSPAAEVT